MTYIPKNTLNLKEQKNPQIKCGIQGASGTGKTWSALTFPNPYVVNFDKGLSAHLGRDIPEVPFWNDDFVKDYGFPPSKGTNPFSNKRDAFKKWMREECKKFSPEQTLIIDSWTTLQQAFDLEQSTIIKVTKKGEVDDYFFWEQKQEFAKEIYGHIYAASCNIVVLFHEVQQRDKEGRVLDKAAPLMQGGFQVQLKVPFDDFFRMLKEVKRDSQGRECGSEYFWQIRDDLNFDAKSRFSKIIPDNIFKVKAEYNEYYAKYGGFEPYTPK